MSAKLHEVLAVESSLEKTARKLSEESVRTLGKENLFKGTTKRLEMFNDQDKNLETSEHQELVTTVDENLEYLMNSVANYWNNVLVKERTNQEATADVVLPNGTVLAEKLPATFLLGLETKLGNLRKVYEAIPTLAPGIKWVPDEMNRAGIFRNDNDSVTFKTKKDIEFKIAYDATPEHPAQVVQLDNTLNVGKYITSAICGMLTPLDKANRITRVDEVQQAVKQARMRANNHIVVKTEKVGEQMLKYING